MKYSLNSYVTIQLTQAGIDIVKEKKKEFHDRLASKGKKSFVSYNDWEKNFDNDMHNNNKRYRIQMWQLMETFGSTVYPGHKQTFHAEIELDENSLIKE